MSEESLKSCGVVLVYGDPVQSFLLMKHSDRWDLPKGHTEPGETELECALREMEEETGISRDDVEIDPDFRFTLEYSVRYKRTEGQTRLKQLVIFLGRVTDKHEIELTEHIGYEWRPWNPPHVIQRNTIDPLMLSLEQFLSKSDS